MGSLAATVISAESLSAMVTVAPLSSVITSGVSVTVIALLLAASPGNAQDAAASGADDIPFLLDYPNLDDPPSDTIMFPGSMDHLDMLRPTA